MRKWIAFRATSAVVVLVLFASLLPLAKADLVLVTGNTGVLNFASNSVNGPTVTTSPINTITGFPAANTLSGPFGAIDYAYSQINSVAQFDGVFSISIPALGQTFAKSEVQGEPYFFQEFTTTTNEAFSWTGSFTEDGNADQMGVGVYLHDLTTNTYLTSESLYRDHGNSFPTSGPGSTLSGLLLAGHTYQIGAFAYLKNSFSNGTMGPPSATGGNAATANGEFHFTAIAVPEPSTLALLGLGGIGSAISIYRRRRVSV